MCLKIELAKAPDDDGEDDSEKRAARDGIEADVSKARGGATTSTRKEQEFPRRSPHEHQRESMEISAKREGRRRGASISVIL